MSGGTTGSLVPANIKGHWCDLCSTSNMGEVAQISDHPSTRSKPAPSYNSKKAVRGKKAYGTVNDRRPLAPHIVRQKSPK